MEFRSYLILDVMNEFLRKISNILLLNSPYTFEDGSFIRYFVQFDILRYQEGRGATRKMLDIPLEYDSGTKLLNVDTRGPWRWRSLDVPLNEPSNSGPPLTETERIDVTGKLREYLGKHPRKYKQL